MNESPDLKSVTLIFKIILYIETAIPFSEFIFGTSLKQTGLYPKLQGFGPDNTVNYAVTLIMTTHKHR